MDKNPKTHEYGTAHIDQVESLQKAENGKFALYMKKFVQIQPTITTYPLTQTKMS